jgi:quinol monooxygenase YgiN
MLLIVGTLTIRPELIDQIRALIQDVRAETLKESGNISYEGHISIDDPSQLVFIERWESRDAFDRHLTQPHLLRWRQAAADFVIARDIEIIHVDRVDKL